MDLFISRPPIASVVRGLWPTLRRDAIFMAVSILGANVMPHNFYLHRHVSGISLCQSLMDIKATAPCRTQV